MKWMVTWLTTSRDPERLMLWYVYDAAWFIRTMVCMAHLWWTVLSTQVCCVRASNRKAMCSESDWVWHYPLSAHWSPAVTWRLWYRCCSPLIARFADCYDDMFRVRAKICPVWAPECCRISSPRFLAKSRKRWLNQGSFVFCCILCCLLFLGCA